jgi:hypothetical protein
MRPVAASDGAGTRKGKGKQRVGNGVVEWDDGEMPKPLGMDLEKLFVDTAITSISANPPDLSLSNKLWCIIDLRESAANLKKGCGD